ncbi:MAG: hypothetical protein WDZ69_02010 [Candidatus Pacearchaeota archaeon]
MAKSEDKSKLEGLRKNYEVLRKKHNLPSFEDLNEDFHIEKISESETEILIREIRKFMGDKIINYMRFLENLINPVNVPVFIYSVVKLLGPEDKKKLSVIYKELMKNEILFIERDLEFDENKEAEFIKDSYKLWQDVKKDLLEITAKVKGKWDDKVEINSKGYFG